MTPREELIEAMALAIGQNRSGFVCLERTKDYARQALASIEAHGGGCVVVPAVATEKMLQAGADASDGYGLEAQSYQAALAASPYAPEPKP